MQFLRRNQDRLRNVAVWIALMLAIRFAVGLLLGESAGEPVSGRLLIVLAAVFAPIMLIGMVGVSGLFRSEQRAAARSITATDELVWPARQLIMRPEDRDNHRKPLAKLGFIHAGSLKVQTEEDASIMAVSLHRNREAVALTTETQLTIVSDYGGKLLMTSNTTAEDGARHRLAQSVPGGSVQDMFDAHCVAHDVVTSQGGVASRFEPDTVTTAVAEWERYDARTHSASRSTLQVLTSLTFPSLIGESRPRITDRSSSQARVAHWLNQPARSGSTSRTSMDAQGQ